MSSIANLTAAEKRAITIAAKAEKERQEQVALQAETSQSHICRVLSILILLCSRGRPKSQEGGESKCRYVTPRLPPFLQPIGEDFVYLTDCFLVWNIDQRATRKKTSSTAQVSEKPKKAKETQSVGKLLTFARVTSHVSEISFR
jgi:hypothetical protein